MKKSKALLLFLLFFQVVGLSAALGADTPLLTWERGQQQSITLGGDTASKLWKLSLVDSSGLSRPFIRSSVNSAGFFIYSIDLDNDIKIGSYEVTTQGPDLIVTTVARVSVIPMTNYNPLQDPRGVGAIGVIAFTILSTFSGSNKKEDEPSNDGSVGSADTKFESKGDSNARDRISYSHSGLVRRLDHWRFFALSSAALRSKLLTRVLADGAYFQGLFGPLSLLLPFAAIIVGLSMGVSSELSQSLVPTSLGLFLIVIIIGIFDSLSGALAIGAFALCALIQGRVNSLTDLRTVLGLIFIAFTPILIASATRPLRRVRSEWSMWERTSDLLIAPLISGWAVHGMVLALDGYSHQINPIATQSNLVGLVAGASIALRYLIEDLAVRFTGARLAFLTPAPMPPESIDKFLKNLTVKAAIFLLFMNGFFGLSWQIFVATAILLLPSFLSRFSASLPNLPALFHIIPTGLPGIVFLTLCTVALNGWINSLPLVASDKSKTIAVLLCLPAFFYALLRLFARYPAPGDVLWYRRERFELLYKFAGVFVFALAIATTTGVIA